MKCKCNDLDFVRGDRYKCNDCGKLYKYKPWLLKTGEDLFEEITQSD